MSRENQSQQAAPDARVSVLDARRCLSRKPPRRLGNVYLVAPSGIRTRAVVSKRATVASRGNLTAHNRAESFVASCPGMGIPRPHSEFRFHPKRQWRFDFAWPDYRVALESDGGTWSRGRHTHPAGFANDREKDNAANLHGWTVLHVLSANLNDGDTFAMVRRMLFSRGKYRS